MASLPHGRVALTAAHTISTIDAVPSPGWTDLGSDGFSSQSNFPTGWRTIFCQTSGALPSHSGDQHTAIATQHCWPPQHWPPPQTVADLPARSFRPGCPHTLPCCLTHRLMSAACCLPGSAGKYRYVAR